MEKKSTTILVTGSKGQVGMELQRLSAGYPSYRFLFVDVDDLDITDQEAVISFFRNTPIQFCINCAAYTAVDKAESQADVARKVNVDGVRNIAKACSENKAQLIQLSTDYVYHNQQNVPFKENDPTQPKSVYAATKLEGDLVALEHNGMVIRTSWVYSSHGHNFVKTMLRLGAERNELGIIFDQIGTPTYARDLAKAILTIIQSIKSGELGREHLSGIYHYSNEGVTSWYDFAKAIFELKDLEVTVHAIETKDYPTPARRPPFSVLNKQKIKEAFGLEIPHWRESLKECLDLL